MFFGSFFIRLGFLILSIIFILEMVIVIRLSLYVRLCLSVVFYVRIWVKIYIALVSIAYRNKNMNIYLLQ